MSRSMGLLEKRCRVFAALVPMYLASLFGSLYLLFPFLILLIFKRTIFHRYIDSTIQIWFGFAVFLLEKVANIKIFVHQSKKDIGREFNKSAIIIMNHRTRLDWLFYFCVLYRTKALGYIKIILKQGLEKIPGAGWAMQAALFIFIKRKWEEDRSHLSFFINYFHQINKKVHLLIFPEGTNLCSWTLGTSDKFANANNLPLYRQVLHPRVTGFAHVFNEMNNNKSLDCVHDVTVAYKGAIPENEVRLLKGKLPTEIHFYIDKFNTTEVSQPGIDIWLNERWRVKEEFLKLFYENGTESDEFKVEQEKYTTELPSNNSKYLVVYPVFWSVTTIIWAYLLYQYAWPRVFFSVSMAFFVYVQMFTKGLQDFIMNSREMIGGKTIQSVTSSK